MQFANPKDGDPAKPENHPQRFVQVACAQCVECTFDKLHGCCLSGGPYDHDLQRSGEFCRVLRR